MKGRLALISTVAACVLATPAALAAPPPPVAEGKASCVGLFASFFAPLGPGISQDAGPGFGSMVVAPFAHERMPCP